MNIYKLIIKILKKINIKILLNINKYLNNKIN